MQGGESRARLRRLLGPETFLIGGLVLVGLALRLPSFGDSLYGDELSTNYVVNGFGVGSVLHIVLGDQEGTPPLFFFLTWLTKGFDGVEGLRVVSLLAGLASIPVIYLVGVRTVGRGPGTVAAALVAISPFQIFYGTEARAYELMMFLCLLATLMLLVAIESRGMVWWVAYALSVAAAAYTHYTSIFVLIAIFGWAFLARPESRKPLLLAGLGAALLYVPWIPELLSDRNEPAANAIALLHPLTLANAENDLLHWSIGHPYIPVFQVPGHTGVWLIVAAVVVGAAGVVLRWRGRSAGPRWPERSGLALVALMAVAAPVGAALEYLVGPSVFSSRNIISCWPGLALLAGVLVTAGSSPWRFVATTLLLAGFAIGGIKMLSVDNQRPDYAGAVRYIDQSGPPGSPVVDTLVITPGAQTPMEAAFAPKGQAYPRGRRLLTLGFPTLQERLRVRMLGKSIIAPEPIPGDAQIAGEAVRAAGPSGTIFVVTGGASLAELRRYPGNLADFLNLLPTRFREVAWRSFPGLGYSGIRVHVLRGT